MPEISLINIEELPSTSSKDTGILLPVALPAGGGTYVLRHISKEDFMKLSGQTVDFDVAGATDVITFSNAGGGYKFIYFGLAANSTMMGTMVQFGVGDGTNFAASLNRAGSTGSLQLRAGGVDYSFLVRDLNPLFDEVTMLNGGSATGLWSKWSTLKVIADGGAIAAGEVEFPEEPEDGDNFKLYVNGTITALTCTTLGTETIDTPLTTATDNGAEWIYFSLDDEWKYVGAR